MGMLRTCALLGTLVALAGCRDGVTSPGTTQAAEDAPDGGTAADGAASDLSSDPATDPSSDCPPAYGPGPSPTEPTEGEFAYPCVNNADCFSGYFQTTLAPDEMLVEVRVPAGTGAWSYEKFNRRAQDWAIVAVAVADGGAGVGLVNMGSTPLRATAVEAAVAGGASAAEAAASAADGLTPPDDINADPEFRSHLARVLTERALNAAGVA